MQGDDMRMIVVGAVVLGALAASGSSANAWRHGWYPWCAWLSTGLYYDCFYATLQQCVVSIRGVGGTCGVNPYPPSPQYARRARPRRGYYYK
jgi:hypothetical protein